MFQGPFMYHIFIYMLYSSYWQETDQNLSTSSKIGHILFDFFFVAFNLTCI